MKFFKLLFLLLLLPVLFSCKEDDVKTPQEPIPSFDLPESPGSYWVYDWYRIDSEGNEVLMNMSDSVFIVGDTIIRGNKYIVLKEEYFGGSAIVKFQRDSLGFIVDQNGDIYYSYTNFEDTLKSGYENYEGFWYQQMIDDEREIVLSSGNFKAIEKRTFFYDPEIIPFTSCGEDYYFTSVFYSNGVGCVLERTGYLNDLINCQSPLERRLVDYFIAE